MPEQNGLSGPMKNPKISRRNVLKGSGALLAGAAFSTDGNPPNAIRVCLGGPITRPRLAAGLEYMTHALEETPALASAFL